LSLLPYYQSKEAKKDTTWDAIYDRKLYQITGVTVFPTDDQEPAKYKGTATCQSKQSFFYSDA